MTFEHPLLLLTLLVVPLAAALYVLAERRRMRYAIRFTNLDVLGSVMGGSYRRRFVPLALFLLALAALCIGMARPRHMTLVPRDRATVILVIDVSRSMESKDVKPSRIGAAAAAVRTFLDRVPDRLQVGLIAFAGDPAVAAPPTTDHDLVRKALDTIEWFPSFGGTAIGDALAAAVKLGQQAMTGASGSLASVTTAAPDTQAHGLVSILFLSDGAQTRGQLEPLAGADLAKAAGIPVYTVALGTPNGTLDFGGNGPFGGRRIPVPPDPATLSAIAARTGGQFYAAQNAKSLQSAYSKLGSSLGRKPGQSEITYAFLAGAALLLVAAGLLSALWSPRLP
ncbi:MAG TPA: VWA domain-containing protein [Gaiellaceae bacterium]